MEAMLGLGLLIPITLLKGYVRLSIGLGILCTNLLIFSSLEVHHFMVWASAGTIAMLPKITWQPVTKLLENKRDSFQEREKPKKGVNKKQASGCEEIGWKRPSLTILAIALSINFIATGFESLNFYNRYMYPSWAWNTIMGLNIYQSWNMFSDLEMGQGWYVGKAQLKNGEWVDILQDGEAITWEEPKTENKMFARLDRWRPVFAQALDYEEIEGNKVVKNLGECVIREWNRDRPEGENIKNLELMYLKTIDNKVAWRTWFEKQ
jgi:hypothetical protein